MKWLWLTTALGLCGMAGAQQTGAHLTVSGTFQQKDGEWYGLVSNDGTVPLDFVKVTATLKDRGGKPVDLLDSYALISSLAPGESSPFVMTSRATAASVQWTATGAPGEAGILQKQFGVTVRDLGEPGDSVYCTVRGSVINTGASIVDAPTAWLVGFGSRGNVTSVDRVTLDAQKLLPGVRVGISAQRQCAIRSNGVLGVIQPGRYWVYVTGLPYRP